MHGGVSCTAGNLSCCTSLELVFQENVLTDGEGSGEECEVTDECAMLLNTKDSSLQKGIKSNDKMTGEFNLSC